MLLDKAEITIKCPKCQRETKKTLGWLKANSRMSCDRCGAEIGFDKSGFTGPMKRIEDGLKRLGR